MGVTIKTQFTLVQHSGFEYGGNVEMIKALEVRPVSSRAQISSVVKSGGCLFADYNSAAMHIKHIENPENPGVVSSPKGNFSHRRIDGLKIFVPSEFPNLTANEQDFVVSVERHRKLGFQRLVALVMMVQQRDEPKNLPLNL